MILGWLLVLGILIYMPSLNGPPIWDDNAVIFQRNWQKLRLNWKWFRAPTDLTWFLTLQLPSTIRIQGLHFGNVLIHVGYALATVPLSTKLGLNPVLVSLIVLAHPLSTSSVAPMCQRAAILSQLFLLLGIDAILWGASPLAIPCFLMALWSKEDAWGLLILPAFLHPRVSLLYRRSNSDTGQRIAGLPGKLPIRAHIPTAFVENLRRLPLWMVGLGLNVDHHVKERKFRSLPFFLTLITTCVVLTHFWINVPIDRPAILLFLISPFWVYLFLPLPHPVVEARAYSLILPIALVIAAHFPFPEVWIAGFAVVSARRSWLYSDQVKYWRSAAHPLRKKLNLIGACAAAGLNEEAEILARKTLHADPNCGLAWSALANLAEHAATAYYLDAAQEFYQHGRTGENHQKFCHFQREAYRLITEALRHCPEDLMTRSHYERIQTLTKHFHLIP